MLNISVSFFSILSKFINTFVPCVDKLLNARCKERCWHQSSQQHANNLSARSFLINDAFSVLSKLRTRNMYCWSRKTLVALHWMHLRVNLICIESFCPQKTNNRTLFVMGQLNGNVTIFNIYK